MLGRQRAGNPPNPSEGRSNRPPSRNERQMA
nr:MAG TPA: hypothetical protein [Caudoviricetes sp.]